MTQSVPLPSGERVRDLIAVLDRLRSPGGCPWDAEQTHHSLIEYLLEEAYETVDALESGTRADLIEELGDLLLQVVFHARIAQEDSHEPFDIDDVAGGIVDKLVRRHPHVFDGAQVDSAAHVESRWQALKAKEKARESVTDGVPTSMPALLLASKLMTRASRGGSPTDSVPTTSETIRQVADDAVTAGVRHLGNAESGVGALLLAIAAWAHAEGIDAEAALRAEVRRYRGDLRRAEGLPE